MMDRSNLSPVVDGGNSVHQEPSNCGEDSVVLNDLDSNVIESKEIVASNANFETRNSSVAVIEVSGSNNVKLSKEEEAKIANRTGQLKGFKGPIKNKSAKTPTSSVVRASLVKRNKDAKDKEAQSAVENTSFDGRQTQLVKSDATSSEVAREKMKPKSLKKGPVDKVQGEAESSLSNNAEDAKPRKVGTLPNYGFSFRCGERAERRREFYSKVEEKIHAKEMEKSNLQAKSKESQEAEMKMLRKSLTFKATPLPTFYQEPPPKVDLKKIPTTKPKSPKLGRKKSSVNSESDGNTSSSSQQGRLTFNEKISQGNNRTKGVTPVHPTKPLRRSLPAQLATRKPTSSNSKTVSASSEARKVEKTVSSVTKKDVKSSNATKEQKIVIPATNEEDSTLPSEITEALPLNVVDSDKPSEAQSHLNGDLVLEENPQLAFAQESTTAEH
ncbi:unnamed protein product [Lupinus luteus]|uniref:TPX2 C-terminal domain-containing protein n=1 Tax=Lupinus luteus TaxID=3873 RepID=A0AAV1XNM9_LUPLU